MTCAACPITVKKVLGRVEGVNAVQMHGAQRLAVVTYDDARVRERQLTEATAATAYPSILQH